MVYKRAFHDEECCKVACKHPRQQEGIVQQSAVLEISSFKNTLLKLHADDGGANNFSTSEDDGKSASVSVNEDLNGANKDSGVSASGNISSYMCVNSNATEEYAESDTAGYLSLFPNYFDLDHRVMSLVQSDGTYPSLLDHSPRKLVSVGPDHQADVPEWAPHNELDSCLSFPQSSYFSLKDDDDCGKKLMGMSVIPMPDLESPAENLSISGRILSNCVCLDDGCVRCVRQHVMEARARLRESLGQKIFEELGFSDMGEEVAKSWTGEEELTFYEVVLSNPASLGKNFWSHLSDIFPSRKMKDLVSYYFNVFVLRKRAEQNRFDPLNIDSDNDEWERSEIVMTEEDDDSVVESLVDQHAFVYDEEDHEECSFEGVENEDETDTCINQVGFGNCRDVMVEGDEGAVDDVSEARVGSFVGDCGFNPVLQLSGKISRDNGLDHDIQDDSCTSYEYQSDPFDYYGPVDLGIDARESSQET